MLGYDRVVQGERGGQLRTDLVYARETKTGLDLRHEPIPKVILSVPSVLIVVSTSSSGPRLENPNVDSRDDAIVPTNRKSTTFLPPSYSCIPTL